MEWRSSNPNLNTIKYQLSVVKTELYEGGKQCNIKADLREAIKTTISETELVEVKRN